MVARGQCPALLCCNIAFLTLIPNKDGICFSSENKWHFLYQNTVLVSLSFHCFVVEFEIVVISVE